MKRKSVICLVLAVLMIIVSFAAFADSNKNARKGLTVRELSLHKYNSRTKEMQQRRLPEPLDFKRDIRNGWDSFVVYCKLTNTKNYSIEADLSMDLKLPDGTTTHYTWDSTKLKAKWSWWYWVGPFTEKGTYEADWYIDDVWLVNKTFLVE